MSRPSSLRSASNEYLPGSRRPSYSMLAPPTNYSKLSSFHNFLYSTIIYLSVFTFSTLIQFLDDPVPHLEHPFEAIHLSEANHLSEITEETIATKKRSSTTHRELRHQSSIQAMFWLVNLYQR